MPLPEGLVGETDSKFGEQGKRTNSGVLSPANGGTGNVEEDFGTLTGGNSRPAVESDRREPGSIIGTNGITLRPARGEKGPRIDIPANGSKRPETLHYPK